MLKKLATALTFTLATAFAVPASAETLNFVRIDGLAEQAVGEKLLTEVYKRAGIAITIEAMPGLRALEQASSGAKDGETLRIFALGENVPSLIRVPTPLSSLKTAGFAKTGAAVTLNSADDIAMYNTVRVAGVLHTEAISQGMDKVEEVRSPDQMFQMVQKGRADLALSGLLDGRAQLRAAGIEDVVHVEPVLRTLELYHYIHTSKADIVPQIDAIIVEMTQSGELADLRAKYEQEYIDSM